LLAVAAALAPGPARAQGDIRVAIADGLKTVEVGGGPMMVSDLAGRSVVNEAPSWLRATLRNGAIEVAGRRVDGLRLAPADVGFLRTNNREYPGALEILQVGDGLLVVNELPLDDYLAGAVKAEAGDKMPLEMLKAQAIVARTYAAYHRRLNAEKSFHLVASTLNQQYVGRVPLDSVVWAAVRETAGQVLLPGSQAGAGRVPVGVAAPSLAPRAAAGRSLRGPAARRDLGRAGGGPRRARAQRLPAGGADRDSRDRRQRHPAR
jgi:stage II sporulation protein D